MTEKHNEQQELRDLDVREEQAEEVKGGSGDQVPLESVSFNFKADPPKPPQSRASGFAKVIDLDGRF